MRGIGLAAVLSWAAFGLIPPRSAWPADMAAGDRPDRDWAAEMAPEERLERLSADARAVIPESAWAMIRASGWIGWIIGALSVLALSMAIECHFALRVSKMLPRPILAMIEEAVDREDYRKAREICLAHDSPLTRVLHAGLSKIRLGLTRMSDTVAEELENEAEMLRQKIGWFNTLAGVAPMLGLLGTVQGMVMAFRQMALEANPSPAKLAGGIFVALLTTFLGLMVAIPVAVIFAHFRGRVIALQAALASAAANLLDRMRLAARRKQMADKPRTIPPAGRPAGERAPADGNTELDLFDPVG